MVNSPIKILVVDDSSVVRTILTAIIAEDDGLEVVGTAPDPFVAREKLMQLKPDVMILDLEMPRMDGLTFLRKVMRYQPLPTLIFSSLTTEGSEIALASLAAGAVDVIAKPCLDVSDQLIRFGKELCQRVRMAAAANLQPLADQRGVEAQLQVGSLKETSHKILAMAASTGGTEALKYVLSRLPSDIPGMVIVQHMPPVFTKTFAQALDGICAFSVKEAEDGERIVPGQALLAPGHCHLEVERKGAYYYTRFNHEAPIYNIRPAADYLFHSVAAHAGANGLGIILTGMGKDGAAGLKAMKAAGSYNLAQNEETCVVFGMPRAAIEAEAIDRVLALHDIAREILRFLS
jgi:two-component system chemotaxis response regulator CheB